MIVLLHRSERAGGRPFDSTGPRACCRSGQLLAVLLPLHLWEWMLDSILQCPQLDGPEHTGPGLGVQPQPLADYILKVLCRTAQLLVHGSTESGLCSGPRLHLGYRINALEAPLCLEALPVLLLMQMQGRASLQSVSHTRASVVHRWRADL